MESDSSFYFRIETGETSLVYHEEDEKFNVGLHTSADKKYLMIIISSVVTSEILIKINDGSISDFKIFLPREHDVDYWIDHQNESWLIGINDLGRNFRLCEVADNNVPFPPDVLKIK